MEGITYRRELVKAVMKGTIELTKVICRIIDRMRHPEGRVAVGYIAEGMR
jgi:hypothetical protein